MLDYAEILRLHLLSMTSSCTGQVLNKEPLFYFKIDGISRSWSTLVHMQLRVSVVKRCQVSVC